MGGYDGGGDCLPVEDPDERLEEEAEDDAEELSEGDIKKGSGAF